MSDSKKPQSNQEMPMEQRLMLAFGLMIVVLGGTSYFMPKPEPPAEPAKPPVKAVETTPAPAPATPPAPAPKPARATKSVAAPPAPVTKIAAAAEQSHVIETDLYKVTFHTTGGVIRSWILKRFKDSKGSPLELVNTKAGALGYPLQYSFHLPQTADPYNAAGHQATLSPDRLGITFEYRGEGWHGRKAIRFEQGSYIAQVSSELTIAGVPKPHLLTWRGGFGDFSVVGAASQQKNVYYLTNEGSLILKTADTAEKEPQSNRGRFDFAGIADGYFAALAIPDPNRDFELHTFQDKTANHVDGKTDPFPGMAIGGDTVNKFVFFTGPKDTDLLRRISPKLENLVDFGYFAPIARPLFLSLKWLNDSYIRNYGWTIVIVTVLINFLLLPLKLSSMKSMKQMSSLQPEIKKIQEKYSGMSMKDPRKANQNQEMMDLYKKHGINPMGGCMPMALQIPFFIAFYNVLSNAIELRGAPWLWVPDLSRLDGYYILPIAMVATQFWMQKMTPATTTDPAQQRMMLLMPLMLGFMFWSVMSGLVLYWLTGNVVGIIQQWFFNRMAQKPAAAAVPVSPTKKK
ncbi:MAG: membrane protein insertase YidC [Acidobacteria bacterium]|nr:membrane protein insertase YidC [Acidobacteriota bacterium]